jgi:hypothetical protein
MDEQLGKVIDAARGWVNDNAKPARTPERGLVDTRCCLVDPRGFEPLTS